MRKEKSEGITIEYPCGCMWYEMESNSFFPAMICSTHKTQFFSKALKRTFGPDTEFFATTKIEFNTMFNDTKLDDKAKKKISKSKGNYFTIQKKPPSDQHLYFWNMVKKEPEKLVLFIERGADLTPYQPMPKCEIQEFGTLEELKTMINELEERIRKESK